MGPIAMFYVGGHGGRCEYFAAGPALRECFDAGEVATKGDVIVSQAVWSEVKDVCQGTGLEDEFYSLKSMEKTFRKKSVNRMKRAELSKDALQSLRSYAPPVLLSAQSLEASLKLSVRSWTVSVIQASVLFVNLGIGSFMDTIALDCEKIHTAVVTVQRIVQTLQGCIHRFTVDDKGCVMKVVFGAQLPHEDQPYRALLAAMDLRHALSLQGIQPAVGVASGESLVGPVGSAVRQEFTVHGSKVILAARLMQLAKQYGGMVLCDEATFQATRDDVRFVYLRPVQLKGRSAKVQPYRPVASSELLEKPMLTAKPNEAYSQALGSVQHALQECSDWLASDAPQFRALVVTGTHGFGKTQLLMQARSRLATTCRVLHIRCRKHESLQRGAVLRRLFAQLCNHDVWPSMHHITPMMAESPLAEEEQENALIQFELRMLNSHAAVSSAGDGSSVRGAISPARLALIIDDIHHADSHSCDLLSHLIADAPTNMFLLMACREARKSLTATSAGLDDGLSSLSSGHRLVHAVTSKRNQPDAPKILSVHLRALGTPGCRALACTELGVSTIPVEVVSHITRRSAGCPLLCKSIARALLRQGVIRIGEGQACELVPGSSERIMNNAIHSALV